ncbi:MAG TPA: GNAT family N-acetyltransferase [Hyphomicrobium sp.]
MGRQVAPPKQAGLTRPTLLRASHILTEFDCGEPTLDRWLQRRALSAIAARTANTFVICRGKRVVGYFSLANGAVGHSETSAKVRRNMPDPIPVTVLARLAVDNTEQDKGLGADLLQEAMKRTLAGARHVAARLLIAHALNAKAFDYYTKHGYSPLRADSNVLYISLETIAATL